MSGLNIKGAAAFDYMFSGCGSLVSLNLSGISAGGMESARFLLEGCGALESVDLSGLDMGNVKHWTKMLSKCYSLRQIRVPLHAPEGMFLYGTYQDAEGNSYYYMPQGAEESITLSREI